MDFKGYQSITFRSKIFLSFLAVPAGPCLVQKSREPLGFLVMRHVGGRFEPYQLLAFRDIKAIKVSPGQKTRGDLVVSTLNEEYGDIQSRNLVNNPGLKAGAFP